VPPNTEVTIGLPRDSESITPIPPIGAHIPPANAPTDAPIGAMVAPVQDKSENIDAEPVAPKNQDTIRSGTFTTSVASHNPPSPITYTIPDNAEDAEFVHVTLTN
jgi:hypothetical protein